MKKTILGLVLLILALLGVSWLVKNWDSVQDTGQPGGGDVTQSATTTIKGVLVCLPHKDTSGPQTMECAEGIRADNGSHYAIDWREAGISAFDLPMNQPITVTGIIVPVEALSSDMWRIYDIRGIIRAYSYEVLNSGIPQASLGTTVTMELNKPVSFDGTTLRVTAVLEDSRCPADVVCIQAGRVRINMNIKSPSGESNMTMEMDTTVTTETLAITLESVTPYPYSSSKIEDAQYRFAVVARAR